MQLNNEVIKSTLPVELIFIPNYIVSALKSRKSNLADFESAIKITLHRFIQGYTLNSNLPNVDIAKQYLTSKLSKIDVEDMLILNNYNNLKLLNTTPNISYLEMLYSTGLDTKATVVNNFPSDKIFKTLETLYDNNMRIMEDEKCVPFETYPGTDCLFVILNSGFSNYIIENNNKLKLYIVSKLLNEVVKCFGEERAKASYIFSVYIGLLKIIDVLNK